MSFFHDRLEAFPRLADYRLAKDAGYWPVLQDGRERARCPASPIEGHEYINFGSNNYLSLSYHPQVIEAAQARHPPYGTGVTGSRLLNGTLDLHRTLEAELAEFYERRGRAWCSPPGTWPTSAPSAVSSTATTSSSSTRTPTTRC